MAILSALLNPEMNEETRKSIFDQIGYKYPISEEVNDMVEGNGKYLYEKGEKIGYGNGETDKALSFIQILMDKHFSFSQIVELLNFNEEERKKYLALLNLE